VRNAREKGGGPREAGPAAAPPSDARVQTTTRTLQLSLFEAEEHPALKALRKLDVTTMTPVEALTRLYELQRQAGGK
jgi:DNA mismatch repair protein MutS